MPESTGPHGPNEADDPNEIDEATRVNTPKPTDEPFESDDSRDSGESDESDDSFDLDETIITRRPSAPTGPVELTGPPEMVRPVEPAGPAEPIGAAELVGPYESAASVESGESAESAAPTHPAQELEVVAAPEEELRVVPIEPYYAEFPEQDTPPEQPEEIAQRPRPERIKRAAVVGARVATGTIGVLVAAAVVAAAGLIPLPSYTAAVPSREVTPVETGQQLVCPGSVVALSDSAEAEATDTTAVGDVSVVSASTMGEVSEEAFADSDSGSGGTAAAPQILATEVDPTVDSGSGEATMLSGAQEQVVVSDDLFGLAAANCASPAVDSWLVGGATTTGRTTLITLSNPSTVAADVDLEIFGELGAVTAPGLTDISVEPGAQRVLSLAGFAPQLASPVVHVSSTGGLVVASLQQTTIRGIEAGGIDLVGASATPSTTTVIPGILVAGADAVASRLGIAGYEDLTPTLRIFVPGTEATEARVVVQSEGGSAADISFAVDVDGGATMDFPLDELGDGSYTVTVDSDAPITAAARTAVASSPELGARTDFAWFSSAPELRDGSMVSIPGSLSSVLHLANPGAEDVTVDVTAVAGGSVAQDAARSVVVPAGSSTAVSVVAGASYALSGFDSLYAGVTSTVDGGVAGFSVAPRAELSEPIVIYP